MCVLTVRLPEDGVRVYMKGADSTIEKMLVKPSEGCASPEAESTMAHVHQMANSGLRTMLYAYRDVTEQELEAWAPAYAEVTSVAKTAETSIRKERLMAQIEKGEAGLQVLGAVGIEDRLQEDVGHTLKTLSDVGVQTWVCTGDKVVKPFTIASPFTCT